MGCIAALSRFISRLGEKALPLYRLLWRTDHFEWTNAATAGLEEIKTLDAEHPNAIPMDPTTSPTTPLGPITRARARALETEVTSLLSQFHFDAHDTWLLPHTDTLCILRYPGEAKEQGQEEEEG